MDGCVGVRSCILVLGERRSAFNSADLVISLTRIDFCSVLPSWERETAAKERKKLCSSHPVALPILAKKVIFRFAWTAF